MNEQLLLFEEPQHSLPEYSLVLAILPDNDAIKQNNGMGELLRKKHGLRGKIRPPGRLHVSLPVPRHISRVPERAVGIITQACEALAADTQPFAINFDRVMSFRGAPENHPLVLVNNDHGKDGIMRLHEMLSVKFAKAPPKFVPHLAVLYDKREVPSKQVEPVCWTVKEIVLAGGEVGVKRYHELGRWAFVGSPPPAKQPFPTEQAISPVM